MTPQRILERWAHLLQPLFPAQAKHEVHGGLGQLRFTWAPHHSVAIFIAPKAVDDFLAAQEAIRASADESLREFVKDNLSRYAEDQLGEFRIVIASIDFVPLQ